MNDDDELPDELFRPPEEQPEAPLEVDKPAPRPPKPVSLPEPVSAPAPAPEKPSPWEAVAGPAAFLIALPLSLLPSAWRRQLTHVLPMAAAGAVTGVLECITALLSAGWLFERYRHIMADRTLQAIGAGLSQGRFADGTEGQIVGSMGTLGATLYIGFLVSPLGLLCFYFFVEGIIRFAAGVAGEPLGVGPLGLVELIRRGIPGAVRQRGELRELGSQMAAEAKKSLARLRPAVATPVVDDEVTEHAGLLRVATCHDRGWRKRTTVDVDGRLYEVIAEETAAPPRARVYVLQPVPDGTALRNVVVYRRGIG